MLKLTIPGEELWDDDAEVFRYTEGVTLEFEHSLVSLSKWEAKHHKLFLTQDPKTEDEMFDYVKAMLLTPDVPDEVFNRITVENAAEIDAYINDPMTGSSISSPPPSKSRSSERISSELIYFWMSNYQIDINCQDWHLNRLFMLIKIHHAKSEKPRKMNQQKHVQTMAEINAQRKAKLGTSG